MTIGRQAKILTDKQYRALLGNVSDGRYALRDRLIVNLSYKQGLRSVEMGALQWGMVLDAEGHVDDMALPSVATKGSYGGRVLPLHTDTRMALEALLSSLPAPPAPSDYVLTFQKGSVTRRSRAATVQYLFRKWYADLGFAGASSHSGRRSFVTHCARNVSKVGGSLRDVLRLSGHKNLASVQAYVDADPEPARKLIEML